MTTFPYNDAVPAANNDPSDDQPDMLINALSLSQIWDEDHIGFEQANGGKHKQFTLINTATPGAQVDPQSIGYTQAGVASSSHPQLVWKNSQGVFPLSAIRAFGVFTNGAASPIIPNNSFNVDPAGITFSDLGNTRVFTIPLLTNAINGNQAVAFVVFSATPTNITSYLYSISGGNLSLTIVYTSSTGHSVPFDVNFAVLQA